MTEPLEVEVGVTLQRLQRQLAAAEARMVRTARKMEGDFGRANTRATRGFNRTGRAANSMATGGLRNASLQLSQLVQQASAGGNVFRALAIQLPDFAVGLGTVGVLAGAAAGGILTYVTAVLGAGENTNQLADQVSVLQEALTALDDASSRSTQSLSALSQQYGENAEAARQLFQIQQQIAELRAQAALTEVSQSLISGFGFDLNALPDPAAVLRGQEAIRDLEDALVSLQGQFNETFDRAEGNVLAGLISDTETSLANLVGMERQIGALSQQLGISSEEGRALAAAFAELGAAQGPQEQFDVLQQLVTLLGDTTAFLQDADEETQNLFDSLVAAAEAALNVASSAAEISNELSAGVSEAQRLRQALGDLGGVAGTNAVRSGVASGAIPPQALQDLPDSALVTSNRDLAQRRERTARTGRRGGGGGGGQSERNDLLREGERLTLRLRTETERYTDELQRIEQLSAAGVISEETAERAIAELDGRLQGLEGTSQRLGSAFTSVFDAVVFKSGNAADAIRRLGIELLRSSVFRFLGSAAPNLFGANGIIPLANANGNAFVNGRVQPFANGGIVSSPTLFPMANGAGLMGEAGPEAILPLKRINGRLGVEATGGGAAPIFLVQNMTGQPARQEQSRGANNRMVYKAIIGDVLESGDVDGPMRRFTGGPIAKKRA